VPAVQKVREAANRAKCTNALKNLGLGLHSYHDTFGCFPPGYTKTNTTSDRATWLVLILPYLEQGNLFRQYDPNLHIGGGNANDIFIGTNFSFLQCPSAPQHGPKLEPNNPSYGPHATGNYAANLGLGPDTCCAAFNFIIPRNPNPSMYLGRGFTSAASSPAGVFLLQLATQSGGGPGQTIASITDGTSNTMALSELLNNKDDPTPRRLSDGTNAPRGTTDWRGNLTYDENNLFNWNYTPNSSAPDRLRPNYCTSSPWAPCIPSGSAFNNRNIIVTPRSMHPGGVNVCMCDGSTRFVTNSISLATWQAIGSPAGGEVLGNGW
jgi:prepilin-type processing-associated H-X9-DG protein